MRADHARSGIVDVSGSGRWCSHRAVPRNHGCCHWCPRHAVPRNHRCCHWRPRHALSPSNHVSSTIMNFPLLVPILILLSDCINSSSLLPVAILCTLLHRENTSFEVWYLEFSTLHSSEFCSVMFKAEVPHCSVGSCSCQIHCEPFTESRPRCTWRKLRRIECCCGLARI